MYAAGPTDHSESKPADHLVHAARFDYEHHHRQGAKRCTKAMQTVSVSDGDTSLFLYAPTTLKDVNALCRAFLQRMRKALGGEMEDSCTRSHEAG